jgi:hypothetical protein
VTASLGGYLKSFVSLGVERDAGEGQEDEGEANDLPDQDEQDYARLPTAGRGL